MDDRMREAVEAGRRNAEAMELMRNWCAYARVRRMGGVGMVEQMTGLPISHFSMECDHAPAGGTACWDFGESALDFYDRNCVSCTKRQPVGFPNLSRLVSERDEARRVADARERVERDSVERALKGRADARRALRSLLDPVNQAVLDDLDAYDRDRDEVDRKRLVEAARLAPDRLDRRVMDLLFEQAGATTSLGLVALEVGAGAALGDRRLLLLAQRLFRSGVGGDCAAAVLLASLSGLSEEDVTDLVPAAAEMARPDHRAFLGDDVELRSDPRLLLEMWRLRPDAVRRGIDYLLDRRNAPDSQLAGRTMELVIDADRAAAAGFVRTAASRYVRARQLLPDLDEYQSLGDMAGALDVILDLEPDALDAVLQELGAGADADARRNIASVYAQAWRGRHWRGKDLEIPGARLRLGLNRLTWLPSQGLDRDVLSTVAGAFRYPPDGIWPLLADRTDELVGAALLLDEKVAAAEATRDEKVPVVDQLEWGNLRSVAYDVVETLLKTAAEGSRDEAARSRFIETVRAIPEERALLRGLAFKAAVRMAGDVVGLKAVLPLLYSGLVGASVLGRAEAALALSEIPSRGRQNVPDLVYEAFCALLLDQFVIVHKYAVRAVGRMSIPEVFKRRVGVAMFHLVSAYSSSEKDDDFLVDCIDQLARFADHLPDPAKAREFCCHAVLKAEPLYVRSEARSLRYSLKASDDFALVVAHVLPDYVGDINQRDEEAELVSAMTPASVLKHKERLVAVAEEIAGEGMWQGTLLADALHRAGAVAEADRVLERMASDFGGTVRDRGRALFVSFPLLAYRMERELAAGEEARWRELATEWKALTEEQRTLLEDRRARDSRSRFSIPD